MTGDAPPVDVRRRVLLWVPRWRGTRVEPDGTVDWDGDLVPNGGFLDMLDDVLIGLAIALVLVLLLATVVPVVVLAVELVIVLTVTLAAVLGRLVLGHPWPVEAVDTETGRVLGRWEVIGWRRAGRACAQLRAAAAFGELPPDGPYDPDGTNA